MSNVETLSSIQSDLQKKIDELKAIENDIKRVTGRDPNEARDLKRQANMASKFEKSQFPTEKNNNEYASPYKKPLMSYDKQPEVDIDADKTMENSSNPILSSVVQVKGNRSRADAVKSLEVSDRERGRRMFGLIQGTLSAAKKENDIKSKSKQEEKRREINARLEEKAKEEKEEMHKQRSELFRNRREHQIELNTLHQKIRLTKEFESWRESALKMVGHIRTHSKPHLYYLPKVETPESLKRIEETKQCIEDMIYHREQRLANDLEENSKFGKLRIAKLDTSKNDDDSDRLMSRVVVNSKPEPLPSQVHSRAPPSGFLDDSSDLMESDTRKVSICA